MSSSQMILDFKSRTRFDGDYFLLSSKTFNIQKFTSKTNKHENKSYSWIDAHFILRLLDWDLYYAKNISSIRTQ